MDELSPKDKERIEAEERYREEVRRKIQAESASPDAVIPLMDTELSKARLATAAHAERLEKARQRGREIGKELGDAVVWVFKWLAMGLAALLAFGFVASILDPEGFKRIENEQARERAAEAAAARRAAAAPKPAPAATPAPTPEPESDIEFRSKVITAAEIWTKAHLKAPATADFPSLLWNLSAWRIDRISSDKVRVSSYVDSQNGFGANLRTYFDIELMKDAGHWVEISFNSR